MTSAVDSRDPPDAMSGAAGRTRPGGSGPLRAAAEAGREPATLRRRGHAVDHGEAGRHPGRVAGRVGTGRGRVAVPLAASAKRAEVTAGPAPESASHSVRITVETRIGTAVDGD